MGSAYPNTLILKGRLNMTGGTFNFTNRSAGNSPGGSMAVFAGGNVLQTGGVIRAGKGFDQNNFSLNGTNSQELSLSNIIDTITVSINNAANVILTNPLVLPYKLKLDKGQLLLQQHSVTVSANNISQAAVLPVPAIVTNGTGVLTVRNVSGNQFFPVAPFAGGYNPLSINNSDVTARTFSAGVAFGIQPQGDIDVTKAVNRTWRISATTPLTADRIAISFQFSDTSVVAGSTFSAALPVVPARYTTQWSYDPYQPIVPQSSETLFTAGPYTPSGIDSLFVIGNVGMLSGLYIFTGTGNWDLPANWAGGIIPPNPLPAGKTIIIDPVQGDCILNVPQTISQGATFRIANNKNLLLPSNLIVQ